MNSTSTTTNTKATKLSAGKVALLLERLLDVKSKTGEDLPQGLDKLVGIFLEAQELFVKGIDKFMHRGEWEKGEEKIVTSIITTCPEVLNTKDEYGPFPLHFAVGSSDHHEANMLYIPLLAKVAYEHGAGGKDGRGSLLVKNDVDGVNALQCCALFDRFSHEIMKTLMEMDPPLFKKEDITEYNLLHCVAGSWRNGGREYVDCLKFYTNLDTSSLFKKNTDGCYPIGQANDKAAAQYLLKRALKYNPLHPSIGGLFSKSSFFDGTTVFSFLMEHLGEEEEKMWDVIQQELSPYKDIPILHRIVEKDPNHIMEAVKRFPHALFLRDANNRLPIHVALKNGMKWSNELMLIMNTNMSHLVEKDPVTGYYPFALAAEEPRCDLKTIHYLLRMHPGQIESGIDKDKGKYEDIFTSTCTSHESKRRRIE